MGNKFSCELYGFEELIERLEGANGNVKAFVTDSLEAIGEDVGVDTLEAVQAGNLPAGGKYSSGKTAEAVVRNPNVEWSGHLASIGVGFDYMKEGAGGWLITGTPRMSPDQKLVSIYKRKTYWKKLVEGLNDSLEDYIAEAMGGG